MRLDLKSAVASDSSKVEDTVRAALRQPVVVDGQTVLPVGTELVGTVTDVERSGRVKGLARVAYRFSSLRHDSERYDIKTAAIAHQAEPTKKKDAVKIGIGAGAGAAIGAILGGGDGAAKGAAIGGAGGTGVVLATRGEEVRRGPGADVTTRLTAPLTVRIEQSNERLTRLTASSSARVTSRARSTASPASPAASRCSVFTRVNGQRRTRACAGGRRQSNGLLESRDLERATSQMIGSIQERTHRSARRVRKSGRMA